MRQPSISKLCAFNAKTRHGKFLHSQFLLPSVSRVGGSAKLVLVSLALDSGACSATAVAVASPFFGGGAAPSELRVANFELWAVFLERGGGRPTGAKFS